MTSFDKFKQILSFVCDNEAKFYREKYLRGGFDVKTLITEEDIQKVPLLTRSELLACSMWDRLYFPLEETLLAGYTSGTTSSELFPLLRNYYIANAPDIDAKKLLLLSMQHWRVVVQAEWFKRKNIFLVVGDINNLPVTSKLSSAVEIDSIYCTPAVALLVAPYLKKEMDIGKIETLLLYGEPLSEVRKKTIQDLFPNATIKTHYAFSEIGPVGFSCMAQTGNEVFHQDDNFYYEVINPETGEILGNGDEGELVITTLKESPTPLIRYRTGDIASIGDSVCSCEKKQSTFRVLGRSGYDMVKIGGLELKGDSFEKGIEPVSHLIHTNLFEVHVYEEKDEASVKPLFIFNIHPKKELDSSESKYIKDTILNNTLIGPKLSVNDIYKKEYIREPKFEFQSIEVGNDSELSTKKRRILIHHKD